MTLAEIALKRPVTTIMLFISCVVFGLLNLTTWWIAHPENWWMGVLHVPLFVVSLALAVTSARRAR